MTTMYAIVNEATEIARLYAELQDQAEFDEDIDEEEQRQLLLTWFGKNKAEFEAKVDSYLYLIAEFKAKSETAKAEAKRLTERARMFERDVDRLKGTLVEALQSLGLDKCKTAEHTVTLAKSPSIAYDVNLDKLPESYHRVKVDADRTAIQKALKAGIAIEGVSVKEEQPRSLRIR